MLEFILFILACFGLTQVLVYGKIFDKIRPKAKFFHCPMCIGFWSGAALFAAFWFSNVFLFTNLLAGTIIYGCISSGTSYLLCNIVGDKGIRIDGMRIYNITGGKK